MTQLLYKNKSDKFTLPWKKKHKLNGDEITSLKARLISSAETHEDIFYIGLNEPEIKWIEKNIPNCKISTLSYFKGYFIKRI